MAISETTKQVVAQQRNALQNRYNKNLKDIEDYEAGIARLKAANATIKKDIDALKKDIPDPKPVDEPVATS